MKNFAEKSRNLENAKKKCPSMTFEVMASSPKEIQSNFEGEGFERFVFYLYSMAFLKRSLR